MAAPKLKNQTLPHMNRELDALTESLQSRLRTNKAHVARVVEHIQKTIITDKLVLPKHMAFLARDPALHILVAGTGTNFKLHNHALGQIAQKVEMSKIYVDKLNQTSEGGWRRQLLVHNLETLFEHMEFRSRGGETKFLLRFVGDELRGFMSRSFGRHLASTPLLAAFVAACDQAGALPYDGHAGAINSWVSAFLPHVFEPVAGMPVAFGVRWSNSDFGAGRLSLSVSIMHVRNGSTTVLSDVLSKVHIGAIIQEGDLEISSETASKELDTAASAIRDSVVTRLGVEWIERFLEAIRLAEEQQVDWRVLKGQFGKLLQSKEMERIQAIIDGNDAPEDLPPVGTDSSGNPIISKWWAVSALSWLAKSETDDTRKTDLQEQAGRFLEVKEPK